MKLKIIIPLIFLLVNITMVNSGFMNTLFDGSVSFLENVRRAYRKYMFQDEVSDPETPKIKSDINEEEDKYLQVVGDGTQYIGVKINKSFDDGLTYHIITDFVPVDSKSNKTKGSKPPKGPKRPSYTDNFYDPNYPNKKELTEEDEASLPPDPADLIPHQTTEGSLVYPTDQDKSYPSNKDGTYGFVVQLTNENNPRFARARGKEVYYFNKIGKEMVFANVMIPIKNNEKKLPPDITSVFKGPDDQYYFIREDAYCRRQLNVSGIGLDPPDYCPEGGDLRELLGCNIRFYPPEVDDLCNNPMLDHSFLGPDNKTAWLIRGNGVWLLHDLPSNPKAAPSKCNMTKRGDATKIWKKLNPKAEALFTVQEVNKKPVLVQFHRHQFTVWNFNGGNPLFEDFIKEMPLNENQYKNQLFTERPVEVAKIEIVVKPKSKIVYKKKEFRDLCDDPTIDSADSTLDGTVVFLYKNDLFYQLEGIKELGFGKLTNSGKSSEQFNGFSKSSSAVMTCKEGRNRGFIYEFNTFYDKTSDKRAHTQFTTWDLDDKIITKGEEWIEPSAAGLVAAFHNRNVTDPVMIAIKGDEVFYYSTVADTFAAKRRSVKHFESREKLPAGVSAAFSMPNQIIYLFKDNHYCVRELFYDKTPPYCPEWRDSRELFGCFGNPHQSSPKSKKKVNKFKAMEDLCSDLNIDDADRTWQREDMIIVWRKNQFWRLADFPFGPRVVESGLSSKKWDGFSESPDAVTIIQEGKTRRGWFYATFGGYWSSWYPDRKPWVGYKAWWGQPSNSKKFGAMMHNGDIKKPLVLGFEGSYVQYYSSEGSILDHKGGSKVDETEEHWPSDITAAFRMEDNMVYLFRGDKYCHRKWKCSNKRSSCCEEWKEAKELFKCDSIDSYSVDGSDSVKDEDYSGNGGADDSNDGQTSNKSPSPENSHQESSESTDDEDRPQETTEEDHNEEEEEVKSTEKPKRKKKKKIIKKKTKKKSLKPDQIFPTPRSIE